MLMCWWLKWHMCPSLPSSSSSEGWWGRDGGYLKWILQTSFLLYSFSTHWQRQHLEMELMEFDILSIHLFINFFVSCVTCWILVLLFFNVFSIGTLSSSRMEASWGQELLFEFLCFCPLSLALAHSWAWVQDKHLLWMIIRMVTLKIFFLTVLGLRCCAWAFSTCSEWGLLSSGSAQASRCIGFSCEHQCMALELGLSSYGKWAYLLCGMWDPSFWTRDQICVPALAGGFLTTGLPGKSQKRLH